MFYTVYKISNMVNNKIYIGKHQTYNTDDNYMGSGKLLKRAIEKYGVENFTKEILFIFDNEKDMNNKESELVTKEFCVLENTYNICPGGNGGFGYINNHEHSKEWKRKAGLNGGIFKFTKSQRKQYCSLGGKARNDIEFGSNIKQLYPQGTFKDKKHTDKTKEKIGLANSTKQKGNNNSQFGTMWITDGTVSKKISKESNIPVGWYKGRKQNIGR